MRDYVDSGIWTVRLIPQRIVTGRYDMWFPAGGILNEGTGFLLPREETTLTIPSTAAKVITVGAYDARFGQLAGFSGRGFTGNGQVKPDLAAPGVEITSCAPGGGVPDPRSASARRRKGFWSAAGISESAGGVGNFMFVGQSAGVGKTGRIAEMQKKDNMKIVQYCEER